MRIACYSTYLPHYSPSQPVEALPMYLARYRTTPAAVRDSCRQPGRVLEQAGRRAQPSPPYSRQEEKKPCFPGSLGGRWQLRLARPGASIVAHSKAASQFDATANVTPGDPAALALGQGRLVLGSSLQLYCDGSACRSDGVGTLPNQQSRMDGWSSMVQGTKSPGIA